MEGNLGSSISAKRIRLGQGCSLSVHFLQLLPVSTGLVQHVLEAIATLSPHSMQTERICRITISLWTITELV